MDLVAQTYEGPAQWFTPAGPNVRLRWYYCDPDAELFPEPHVFGSGNYDTERGLHNGLGDVPLAKRTTRDFFAPPGAAGKHYCGPLEWYQRGIPLETLGTRYVRLPSGLLGCCNPELVTERETAAGEVSGGGLATVEDWCESLPPLLYLRFDGPFPWYAVLKKFVFDPGACPVWTAHGGPFTVDSVDLPLPCLHTGIGGLHFEIAPTTGRVSLIGITQVFGSSFSYDGDFRAGPPQRWVFSGVEFAPEIGNPPCYTFERVTVQAVPFGPVRETAAGEVSGGGLAAVPTRETAAGEVSGGGLAAGVVSAGAAVGEAFARGQP